MLGVINIVLVGSNEVGKTTWVSRFLTGEFQRSHISHSFHSYNLPFMTTKGMVTLNVVDCSGMEFAGVDPHVAFIMFDVENSQSYKDALSAYTTFKVFHPNKPAYFLANKVDSRNRVVKPRDVTFRGDAYFEISAKTNYHFDQPFLKLCRDITGDKSLIFLMDRAAYPPDVIRDLQEFEQFEKNMTQIES